MGMWVVKVGGPAYRIGMGGGAACSMVQGENVAELDFNAVQRGDAEMEQKVNRVLRACVETGRPTTRSSAIHDQGAGGNCNVLKEIVDPAGARASRCARCRWATTRCRCSRSGARSTRRTTPCCCGRSTSRLVPFALCEREKVPVGFVGRVTGDGTAVVLRRRARRTRRRWTWSSRRCSARCRSKKSSNWSGIPPAARSRSTLPDGAVGELTLWTACCGLLSVGSKRFLTTKVDRCVTGLVARQQCAGPAAADGGGCVAVIAQSHFAPDGAPFTGAATAIGEQPIKGLVDPGAMARLCVGEALTNLVWARVSAPRAT